jgi:hypothetical protein
MPIWVVNDRCIHNMFTIKLFLTLPEHLISSLIQIFLFPIKEPFQAEQLTKNLIE